MCIPSVEGENRLHPEKKYTCVAASVSSDTCSNTQGWRLDRGTTTMTFCSGLVVEECEDDLEGKFCLDDNQLNESSGGSSRLGIWIRARYLKPGCVLGASCLFRAIDQRTERMCHPDT